MMVCSSTPANLSKKLSYCFHSQLPNTQTSKQLSPVDCIHVFIIFLNNQRSHILTGPVVQVSVIITSDFDPDKLFLWLSPAVSFVLMLEISAEGHPAFPAALTKEAGKWRPSLAQQVLCSGLSESLSRQMKLCCSLKRTDVNRCVTLWFRVLGAFICSDFMSSCSSFLFPSGFFFCCSTFLLFL